MYLKVRRTKAMMSSLGILGIATIIVISSLTSYSYLAYSSTGANAQNPSPNLSLRTTTKTVTTTVTKTLTTTSTKTTTSTVPATTTSTVYTTIPTTITRVNYTTSTLTTTATNTVSTTETATETTTATQTTTSTTTLTATTTQTDVSSSTSTFYTTVTTTVPVTTTTTQTSTTVSTSTQTVPVTTTLTETDTTLQTLTTTTTSTVTTSIPPYANYGCTDPANEQSGITCSWLSQQAVAWKPATNASIGWTAQFTEASYDNIEHTSNQTLFADLNMLVQSGASCIRIDIGYDPWLLPNVTAQNEMTSVVNAIRADGKCLIFADAGAETYWTNKLPWSQFQTAWVSRVQALATLYHPDFYVVIKEPYWYFDMISDNTTAQVRNGTSWSQLAQTLANTVQSVSPSTLVGVSTSFGALGKQFYVSFVSGTNAIPNVDFVGFDIYTVSDFTNTQSIIGASGLSKNVWISEGWSTAGASVAFSSDRASLDQLWIQDLYYFGLYIHATNINPFYTNCFSSYNPSDLSYTGRTLVFYEYQHLATSYDGRVE